VYLRGAGVSSGPSATRVCGLELYACVCLCVGGVRSGWVGGWLFVFVCVCVCVSE
jgi:hypothetical protein